jgi:hypothetical protein
VGLRRAGGAGVALGLCAAGGYTSRLHGLPMSELGKEQESKPFFFEKKNQKTFDYEKQTLPHRAHQ